MLRVLIEAKGERATRLETFLAGQPDLSLRRSTDRAATRAEVEAWRPHLLVIDPDHAPAELAPFVAEAGAHALAIAFLPPHRRERAAELLSHSPIGVLPDGFDRGDVTSLLMAARGEAELPAPQPPGPSRPVVEMLALGSVATALLVGFSLPGVPALLQGDRPGGYLLTAALSLVALAALIGARRPWAAALQAALVGLVALAPTQA